MNILMDLSVLKQLDSRLSGCLELKGEDWIRTRGGGLENNEVSPLRRPMFGNRNVTPAVPERTTSRYVSKGDKTPAGTSTTSVCNEFHVISHESMDGFARKLMEESNKTTGPSKTTLFLYNCRWGKFSDLSDDIEIENMKSPTQFKDKNILFLASFHNNDVTMSQFHVISFLCECLAASVTVLLPYYSTGTMERVDINKDGVIPTANTLALLFNGLPSVGRPIRMMTYDLHTLQNRFYLTGHAVATLHTAIPLLIDVIRESQESGSTPITAVAFPDEGSHKRFGIMFKNVDPPLPTNLELIICSKVREGTGRVVKIAEGDASGKHVIIIDDQTKSGGTLIECARALKRENKGVSGAALVSGFVTHAICTDDFWSRFIPAADYIKTVKGSSRSRSGDNEPSINVIENFYCTDSFPIEDEIRKIRPGKILSWMKVSNVDGGEGKAIKEVSEFKATIDEASLSRIQRKIQILSLNKLVLKDL